MRTASAHRPSTSQPRRPARARATSRSLPQLSKRESAARSVRGSLGSRLTRTLGESAVVPHGTAACGDTGTGQSRRRASPQPLVATVGGRARTVVRAPWAAVCPSISPAELETSKSARCHTPWRRFRCALPGPSSCAIHSVRMVPAGARSRSPGRVSAPCSVVVSSARHRLTGRRCVTPRSLPARLPRAAPPRLPPLCRPLLLLSPHSQTKGLVIGIQYDQNNANKNMCVPAGEERVAEVAAQCLRPQFANRACSRRAR